MRLNQDEFPSNNQLQYLTSNDFVALALIHGLISTIISMSVLQEINSKPLSVLQDDFESIQEFSVLAQAMLCFAKSKVKEERHASN